jgi:phage terminase large subunit
MRTRKQVRISEIVIPKYLPVFNNKAYKHIILTSGRAGTKSSFAAIRTDYQIVADPHGSAVVLRKHHNKLRKTVYKEMLRGINRLQIPKNRFYITKSPMEITYKKYNTTIYFSGSDGIDDTKGIIDEDKPIKLVVLDELTEFFDDGEGEDELANIEATFVRGNKAGFQMIYLYNPPKNPNAPVNLWCKKMEQRSFTYIPITGTFLLPGSDRI